MNNETNRNDGRFRPGHKTWNKGLRGYMGANRTSFTKERADAAGRKAVGVGRLSKGWSMCLTEERIALPSPRNPEKTYMFRKRMGTARYVLEKAGMSIGPSDVIWHIDGDPSNNSIENLEVIDRAELARRNLLKRWSK